MKSIFYLSSMTCLLSCILLNSSLCMQGQMNPDRYKWIVEPAYWRQSSRYTALDRAVKRLENNKENADSSPVKGFKNSSPKKLPAMPFAKDTKNSFGQEALDKKQTLKKQNNQ